MRIFPEMCPSTTCPFSSLTLKVALGRVSTISPCIWITSSFDISGRRGSPFALAGSPRRPSSRREPGALKARLLQEALVLVAHDVRLHLRHEVHRDHHDDQQARPAEVERHVPPEHEEL